MSDIPIVRLARWVVRRRASCEFCRTEPRVEIDGERRYCSTKCAEQDAWAQANG